MKKTKKTKKKRNGSRPRPAGLSRDKFYRELERAGGMDELDVYSTPTPEDTRLDNELNKLIRDVSGS